jgi:hypothetical protein
MLYDRMALLLNLWHVFSRSHLQLYLTTTSPQDFPYTWNPLPCLPGFSRDLPERPRIQYAEYRNVIYRDWVGDDTGHLFAAVLEPVSLSFASLVRMALRL